MFNFIAVAFYANTIGLYLWFLYAMFVLRREHPLREKYGPFIFHLLVAPAYLGVLLDIFYQWTWACLVFWKLPQDLVLTKRLQRYRKTDVGWRTKLAAWICDHLLNRWDPEHHHC